MMKFEDSAIDISKSKSRGGSAEDKLSDKYKKEKIVPDSYNESDIYNLADSQK